MGIGKVLGYATLGVIGGIAAVAAAPFTGGGSLIGAATLATSLAGAGTIAAATGAAAVAGGAGAYLARKEDEDNDAKDQKIAELNQKVTKLAEGLKKALQTFEGDKAYFNFIISMVALGLAMANADGEISTEEKQEIDEFVGGIANSKLPPHVKNVIDELSRNTPNLMTAMRLYVSKIDPQNYDVLRDLLQVVMLADNIQHERETSFMAAFEQQIWQVDYQPETIDTNNEFLLTVKNSIA